MRADQNIGLCDWFSNDFNGGSTWDVGFTEMTPQEREMFRPVRQRLVRRGEIHRPALEQYLAKIIAAGRRAAVCEQMEDPKTAKGLVRREVTRVLTPGTLVEAVRAAIFEETGITTELSTTGGTSDGRFIAQVCPQVIELGPPNATIHKIDEHVAVADIEPLKNIYRRTLERLAQQAAA